MPAYWFRTVAQILRSRKFIIVFAVLVAVFSPLSAMSALEKEEPGFVEMTTLGTNMRATDYFPDNNATISAEQQLKWHIRVHNQMGNADYLSIRIKLLNSTGFSQNNTIAKPSAEPVLFEERQLVVQNATWIIPINWTIAQAEIHDDYATIESITINNKDIVDLNITNNEDQSFRMIIELWRYNSSVGDFEFAWSSDNHTRSVWNQIWFNVKN